MGLQEEEGRDILWVPTVHNPSHVSSFHICYLRMKNMEGKARIIYNLCPEKCKWSQFLILHRLLNMNFQFLFNHVRVQLGQYKISRCPPAIDGAFIRSLVIVVKLIFTKIHHKFSKLLAFSVFGGSKRNSLFVCLCV